MGDELKKLPLHFGIIYSNPLISIVKNENSGFSYLHTSDPVDFAGECASIIETF